MLMTEGLDYKPELVPADRKHVFALEAFSEASQIPDVGAIDGTEGVCVGVFEECIGEIGKKHALYAAPTFESLRQSLELRRLTDPLTAASKRDVKFLTPTSWSPMQ